MVTVTVIYTVTYVVATVVPWKTPSIVKPLITTVSMPVTVTIVPLRSRNRSVCQAWTVVTGLIEPVSVANMVPAKESRGVIVLSIRERGELLVTS